MVVVRDVWCRIVQGVQGGVLIVVSVMVGVKDVNLKGVGKVLKVVRISVRHMGVGRGARGASRVQNMGKVMRYVINLLGGKMDCVHLMVRWFKIIGSMVEPPWELWFMTPLMT